MHLERQSSKSWQSLLISFLGMAIGAFLAALSVEFVLVPNSLIDGGVVGMAMIAGNLFGQHLTPLFLISFNIPFLFLAYRCIGKTFVFHMLLASFCFALSMMWIHRYLPHSFSGDTIEIVVFGGSLLGAGIGLIIRYGGCLDGTEILGLILNRAIGLTVGQVVFVCNVFVFTLAGIIFQDWHPPLLSLITYVVAVKVMDAVILGLHESKSMLIVSKESRKVKRAIIRELQLGVTVMYGRGGYSDSEKEILYVIAERLQLSELKELVHSIDPTAFIAIENLHELSTGRQDMRPKRKVSMETLFQRIFRRSKSSSAEAKKTIGTAYDSTPAAQPAAQPAPQPASSSRLLPNPEED
ncbi:MAG: hypothetical protein K0S07_1188 [Chlamydiales bacterium]|jgi:uncharacterized membrane-anchored protein YitT (DUF2179 family)|nr:hypothetical protein [Chlamydiales bacterium]